MEKLLGKVKELFEKFKSQSKKIKIAVIASVVAVIIAIASAVVYSTSNKYAILFSNLDSADAKTVVDYLTTEKIENKVDSTNNTIWVPKTQVDKLKLELAPDLKSGSMGYELMDEQSSFGSTDEEFKLKKKRMLQGEIEKTIKSLQPIENAKVNITEPESSVFVKDKTQGSAAVTIKLKEGASLTEDQVKAIVSVVSTSIENVPKENVTIIDQYSNLLTRDLNEEENGQASSETISKQHKAEQDYEERLKKEIVALLEPIVGKGNVTASVKANLDFDAKQNTQTIIDPNKVIVSQETLKEMNKNGGDDTTSESPVDNNMSNEIVEDNDNTTSTKEEQKTNYDSGKSESKTIEAQGKVERLTATVYINKANLTQQEKDEFQSGVANAIGINEARGDQITVSGMAFDTTSADQAQAAINEMNEEAAAKKRNIMMIVGGLIAAILIGIIAFFVIRNRKRKEEEEEQLLDTLIDDTIIPKEPETFDPIEFETQTEKSHLENEIKRYATEKPEQVVEIIKSWLTENER
ncbi:MAG: flagellar basal-body MS-ring/collar protein FliF [Clostridium sp.]